MSTGFAMKTKYIILAVLFMLFCPFCARADIFVTQSDNTLSPEIPMYQYPTDTSDIVAYCFGSVAGSKEDQGSGYIQLKIGNTVGWMHQEYVSEQDTEPTAQGSPAKALTWGDIRYRSVYDQPDKQSTVLAQIEGGYPLRVLTLQNEENWVEIVLADGLRGYMQVTDVLPDAAEPAIVNSDTAYERLNLRAKPSTKSKNLGKYYSGTLVYPLYTSESLSDWMRVSVYGYEGWMKKEFLRFNYGLEPMTFLSPISQITDRSVSIYESPDYQADILFQTEEEQNV